MRCKEFYHRWEEDPNWCEKTPGAVSQINAYLDLVRDISARAEIEKDTVYEKFSERAARVVITIKDDAKRPDLLNYVIACLKRGEVITGGDLKKFTMVKEVLPLPMEKDHIVDVNKMIHKSGTIPESQKSGTETITDTIGEVSPSTDIPAPESEPWSSDVCKSGTCPDGADHVVVLSLRGPCCDLVGAPLNQLSNCPILQRKKADFRKASEIDPLTGGKFIKPAGIKVIPTRNPIVLEPSRKQWEFIEEIIKSGEFETPAEFLMALIDRAMEVT